MIRTLVCILFLTGLLAGCATNGSRAKPHVGVSKSPGQKARVNVGVSKGVGNHGNVGVSTSR